MHTDLEKFKGRKKKKKMLLRSSSTPILGSLLSSSSSPNSHHHFSAESPNHHHHHHHHIEKTPSLSPSPFLHGHHSQPQDSPIIRRAVSDGNLHSLLSSSHHKPNPNPNPNPVLDTIPSFSVFNSRDIHDEEDFGGDRFDETEETDIGRANSGGFSFVGCDQNPSFAKNSTATAALPLFLARGLGIDRLGSGFMNAGGNGGGGGCGGGGVCNGGSGGGERSDLENYYKMMLEEDPHNALFLSNYAQFLYEFKGDSQRAEEYYSRAILADPNDGEILSQYAKLVWELHNDKERASSYFERAVCATPNNCNVLAAHASFLWETEDDEDGIGDDGQSQGYFGAPVHQGVVTRASSQVF